VINANVVEHHCFGCGDLNPIGMRLKFREVAGDDGVWAGFTPDRRHEGYLGMVHGGILTAMLDEAMSWAITATGEFAITARMEVSFRSPARVGQELRVIGRVTRRRSRVIDTAGTILEDDGDTVVAESEGRFVRVSDEQAAAWRNAYLLGSGRRVRGARSQE
jgi:uncharacterized protein (TIGR00369 family)